MKIGLIGLTVALSATLSGCLDMEMKKPWYPYYLKCPEGFTKATINSLEECPEDTKCEVVVDPEDPSHVQYCRESLVDYSNGGGINCDAGFISVSKSEQSKCVVAESVEELDESLIGDENSFPCIEGKLSGRYCRLVTPEKPGSLVDVRDGQRCSTEQAKPDSNTLRVHLIDIGQGDAIWIQTPDGKNVLIDGGDGGSFGKTSAGPIISDYLNTHGFPYKSTFDAVILTHPHADHFGGFNNLFNQSNAESYKLANYLDPMDMDNPQGSVPETYKQWINRMKAIVNDTSHIYMPAKQKFNPGESLPVDFFGPDVETQYITSDNKYSGDDANPASIIFKLTYKGVSFIFSGDAEAQQEANAIATGVPLDTNFFKVCHHGSSTSSTQAFLDAMWNNIDKDKRYAVISSGRKEYSGSLIPTNATINRLLNMIEVEHLYSTTAGDDAKREFETYRDDNILIVVKPNGESYTCYNGTN